MVAGGSKGGKVGIHDLVRMLELIVLPESGLLADEQSVEDRNRGKPTREWRNWQTRWI